MGEQAQRTPGGALGAIGGFELLEKIGQGAMGAVFRARQRSLDRIVALKVLPPSFAKDQRFIERFQREARAVARLAHHHIVQAIDSGKDEATGLWYFAMEYVDGPSLGTVLKERGPLPERQLLEIGRQIAQALECAHSHRIVHRDVKPDNILLTSTGEAKLADLGLARRADEEGGAAAKSGAAIGTPNYMAPEQIRGQLDRIDVRTDLYSLGATLFHLATGQPPFGGTTAAAIMAKHLTEKPPLAHRISDRVGEPFSRLIVNLMQKEPAERPQTPSEVIAQFDRILELTGSRKRAPIRATTGPRSPVRTTERRAEAVLPAPEQKSPAVLIAILGVAVLAAGGAAGWYFSSQQAKSRERTADVERERPAPPRSPEQKPAPVPEKPAATEAKKEPAPEPEKKVPTEPEKPGLPEAEQKAVTQPAEKKAGPDEGLSIAKKDEPPPAEAASGFRAEYFEGQAFQTPRLTASLPTLDVSWPTGGPPGVALGAGVSARWSGFVKPEESGPHCFELTAQQGARLYLDRCLLADLWSGRPSAGRTAPVNLEQGKKYLLTFELRCGRPPAMAQVRWGRPGGPLGPVSAEPPEMEAEGLPVGHLAGGWQVTYGQHGADRQPVNAREWTVDHDWGGGAPVAGVGADGFWARWSGVVVPPETADYILQVDVHQGAKLSIGNVLVLDAYHLPPGKTSTVPLRLEKGKRYATQLEYRKRGDEARCRLTWSRPGREPEPVVASAEGEENLAALGVGFQAEYGGGATPRVLVTRHDIQAGWDWRGGSPDAGVPADNFWANYAGWISPPASGLYSFVLDWEGGVRFWLDDCLLFERQRRRDRTKELLPDEATVALEGGKHYYVRLEFWARLDSKHLLLKWRAKDLPEQLVPGLPPDAFRSGDKDAGRIDTALLAEYGTAKEPIIKRLEGAVSHEFGGGTPGPDVPGGPYWGRWNGGLRPKENGLYVFQIETDNTAEMKLNRISLLRISKPGKAETHPIQLQKGTVCFLELSYSHRSAEAAFFRFSWKPPGKTEFEPVPADAFLLSPEISKTFNRAVPK